MEKSHAGSSKTRQPKPVKGAAPTIAAKTGGMDLSSLFGVAAQALTANQGALNQADTENQNHGDNMVQTFNMITQALAGQSGGTPAQQLSYASQYLGKHANSGSAHVYSQALAQAAQQMQGQPTLNANNVGTLIQALLGDGTGASGGADMISSLLGGGQTAPGATGGADLLGSLLGGGQPAQSGEDLLGSLLGAAGAGSQPAGQADDGIDLGDVLNAGLAFMNAKQQGQSTLQAALSAIMAAGPMAQKPYRQQSGQVVAGALLQAISGLSQRK